MLGEILVLAHGRRWGLPDLMERPAVWNCSADVSALRPDLKKSATHLRRSVCAWLAVHKATGVWVLTVTPDESCGDNSKDGTEACSKQVFKRRKGEGSTGSRAEEGVPMMMNLQQRVQSASWWT